MDSDSILNPFWSSFWRQKPLKFDVKIKQKEDAILRLDGDKMGQASGHRDGSQTDLRSDQEQEFQEKVQLGVRPVGRAGL